MKKLIDCSETVLNVKVSQFFRDNYPRILSFYRVISVDIVDQKDKIVLIGYLGEHLFICYLIWDENKEEFIDCKNLGLYDVKTREAQKVEAKDLEDVILKLYTSE